MGSESSKTQLQSPIRTRKKPPPPPPTSAAAHRRRRPMGPASCIIEWLKPDCLNPDKPKKSRPKNPYTSSAQCQSSSAVAAGGSSFISLEEHLSTSSPLVDSGQPVSTRFPRPASKKPSPKRIHPSSSTVAAGGCGRRQRKGKGKSKRFTLETLVKLDQESKEDHDIHEFESNRSNSVSRNRDGGGSSMGPAGSQSCSRPEVMKKAKSVRFTLPGEGDIFVFYSPKTADDRAFHSL